MNPALLRLRVAHGGTAVCLTFGTQLDNGQLDILGVFVYTGNRKTVVYNAVISTRDEW